MKNYYQILGLNEDATLDEIKAAYKLYALKFHPDKHKDDDFFKEKFQEVQEAYAILIKQYTQQTKETFTTPNIILSCNPALIRDKDYITIQWAVKSTHIHNIIIQIDNGFTIKEFDNQKYYDNKTIKINRIKDNVKITLKCYISTNCYEKSIYINKINEPTPNNEDKIPQHKNHSKLYILVFIIFLIFMYIFQSNDKKTISVPFSNDSIRIADSIAAVEAAAAEAAAQAADTVVADSAVVAE